MSAAQIVVTVAALYAAAGVLAALGFVTFGLARVTAAPATFGARLLILPGAALLWPLILARWMTS